jgi:predicted RNA-binding Zn-ribbon protein involved in translation (DUF1610 family)
VERNDDLDQLLRTRKATVELENRPVKSTLPSAHPFHLEAPFPVFSVGAYSVQSPKPETLRMVGHIVEILPTSEVYRACPRDTCSKQKLPTAESPSKVGNMILRCKQCRTYVNPYVNGRTGRRVPKLKVQRFITVQS